MTQTKNQSSRSAVLGVDHVELFVLNQYQAVYFYRFALGLQPTKSHRPCGEDSSVVLQRNDIRLVVTSPLTPSSPIAEHLRIHGEGVKDVALAVRGLDDIFERACDAGAKAISNPASHDGASGSFRSACIGVFGDVVHTLIESEHLSGGPRAEVPSGTDMGLDSLDHVAMALRYGDLDKWAHFYVQGLGFRESHQEDVSTEYSAMRSKVVESENGRVRFPIMEPANGKRKSQIEVYLDNHVGPGTQHLAFRSNDITASVAAMAAAGVDFLSTPAAYYETLEGRVGKLPRELDTLKRLGILVDRDPQGILLQVFTKPIGTRPTLFLELVERQGAAGFGSGNIRALFEAVERSQAAAGGGN